MRRGFALVLTVFLCFQALWAAAAPYCAHEADPQRLHMGHHAHEHVGPEAAPTLSDDGLATSHADCHVCHGAHALALQAGVPAATDPRARLHTSGPSAWPPAPATQPERPNWPRLA